MKKQSLLFVAGAMLAFASCQTTTTQDTATQEQIDSAVNARVEEMRIEMQAQNDSIIMAEAQRRVDSILAAGSGNTTPARSNAPARHTTTGSTKTTTTSGKTTIESGGLQSQSDQNKVNSKRTVEGGGLQSQSDQNRAKNNSAVEKGGLQSQSDQNKKK